MHCIPEYYTQKHIIHTFKPVIIDRTGTYIITTIYLYMKYYGGKKTSGTRMVIGRRRTSPSLLNVCVCVIITTYAMETRSPLQWRRRSRHNRGLVSILDVARPTGFPRFICLFFSTVIHVIVLGSMKICSFAA